jgi:quinol monooxygenase YgiN
MEVSNLDGPLVYIDHSDIKPGKVAELTRAVSALVEFVEQREPQLLSYGFHIDPGSSTMTVVAVHPDRASLQIHLDVGGPEFRKVGEFIELRLIEVYGDPGSSLRELLQQKARMLGRAAQVVVRERTTGFARLRPAEAAEHHPTPRVSTGR